MERLIFEGRFLVNMVGGIVCQNVMRTIHSGTDWEKLFKTADYHRISSIIYLGILGNGERVPERWRERFFERYRESLYFCESCEESEREVIMMLDMMEIPCTVLTSCSLLSLYRVPEMAAPGLLKIHIDEQNYVLAKGYLIDLGYETEHFHAGYGERMKNPSGFSLEIYHKLPFRTRVYEKNMRFLLDDGFIRKNCRHVMEIPLETQFVYMMAEAAYSYTIDELLIRKVLDLYLFHKAYGGHMTQEAIWKRLEEFQVDGLAKNILQIAYMWFGSKGEFLDGRKPEDMGVFDIIENRILSRGVLNRETDRQALKLRYRIQKEIEKEEIKEKRQAFIEKWNDRWKRSMGRLRWFFPGYRYMCSIYPVLENVPILLPLCWIWRGLRHLKRFFHQM